MRQPVRPSRLRRLSHRSGRHADVADRRIRADRLAGPACELSWPWHDGTMPDSVPSPSKSGNIRRPRQKRSQERFEAILDAAENVLDRMEVDEVSIYTIAEQAGMTPPSIYHFFPDAQHVFVALAERFLDVFRTGSYGSIDHLPIETWQDWVDARYGLTRKFFNDHSAARKVILSAGSWAIRSRDLDMNAELAKGAIEELDRYFIVPEIPGLARRIEETIVMSDALWALANHRHGYIPDEDEAFVRRARIAHMRTYLPEFLPRRDRPAARTITPPDQVRPLPTSV